MNSYSVKIDAFEGPLDLLLHLINQAEVDIYDIPVAQITDQYVTYIETMQELELDIASEYLVMAATLLAIKSQMLLPKQEELFEEEWVLEEEEDPREELMLRLIEYRKYKEAANELKEKEKERSLTYTRAPDELDQFITEAEKRELAIQGVTLFDMLAAYQKLTKRKALQAPKTKTVKSQEYSIEEKIEFVLNRMSQLNRPVHFEELFYEQDRGQIVMTFLAVLELMKTKSVRCIQDENFTSIMIYRVEGGNLH
ncbi:segregation/condensation protein A [Halalkalibacter sp. AB-rgal2]|uniref:segregation/condensation protein A n=1 Tax=Halalkalibacter sp. AB-rgal2 TaxID=3242695 RepID=UPI00359E9EB8